MNRNPIKYYNEFVNEAFRDDAEKHAVRQELDDLNTLHGAGLVDREHLRRKRAQVVKQAGGSRAIMQDPILGEVMAPDLYRALQSPEWQTLEADGWRNIANDRHLFNGSLLITTPATGNERAMQITASKYIRRVRINVEWKGDPGVIISGLPGAGPQVYINGMKWVNANIDPTTPGLDSFPKELRGDPGFSVQRYGAK